MVLLRPQIPSTPPNAIYSASSIVSRPFSRLSAFSSLALQLRACSSSPFNGSDSTTGASVVSLIPWFHLSRLPSPARDFVRRVVIVRESASALPLPHLLKHPEHTVHRVVVGSLGLATLVLGTSALLNAGSALSWHWSKDKRAIESEINATPPADTSSSPE
ncbi:unnamed protein product [Closterium sp. NIES-64]|nr:unnamed protein product [Closterium sp. NIES-64]